jgi:hypothetical protein
MKSRTYFLLFFITIFNQFELRTESWYQKVKNKITSFVVGKKNSWKPFYKDENEKIHFNYRIKNAASLLLIHALGIAAYYGYRYLYYKETNNINLNQSLGYHDPFKNSKQSKNHFFNNICKIHKSPSSPMFYIVPVTFLTAGGLAKFTTSKIFKSAFAINPYLRAASLLAYLPGLLYTTRYFPENMFLAKIYKLLHFNNPDQVVIVQLKLNEEGKAKSAWYKRYDNNYEYEKSKINGNPPHSSNLLQKKSENHDNYIFIHGSGVRAKGPESIEVYNKSDHQLIRWEGGISTDIKKASDQIANALSSEKIKLNKTNETQFLFYSYGNTVGIKGIEKYVNECIKTNLNPFPSGLRIIMAHPALEKEAAVSTLNILNKIDNCKVFSINSPGDNIGSYNPFAARKPTDLGRAGVGDFTLQRKIEKLSPAKQEQFKSKVGYITPLPLINSNSEKVNEWDKKFLYHKVFSLEEPRKPFIDFLRKNEDDLIGKNTTLAIHNTMDDINKRIKAKNETPVSIYN